MPGTVRMLSSEDISRAVSDQRTKLLKIDDIVYDVTDYINRCVKAIRYNFFFHKKNPPPLSHEI